MGTIDNVLIKPGSEQRIRILKSSPLGLLCQITKHSWIHSKDQINPISEVANNGVKLDPTYDPNGF